MSDKEFDGFLQKLGAEVRDRALGSSVAGEADFKENAFTEVVTEFLAENGVVEDADILYFQGRAGRGTGKVNGYSLNDQGDMLEVFTSLYIDAAQHVTIPADKLNTAGERASRFIQACFNGFHKDLETASDAHGMARSINEAASDLKTIRIHILTDGVAKQKKVPHQEANGISVRLEIWDAERLFRAMQAGLPRDEIVIDFEERFGQPLPCLPMPAPAVDYMAYMAVISGETLYSLYDEYGARLLEFNVRSYLQARGKVNRGIRDTLKNEPEHFFGYNNGIVATVDSLEIVQLDDGRPAIRRVYGIQIVNGGQTTVSIYQARKKDKIDISAVQVPLKITAVESNHIDQMVKKISLYANTQNVIQVADFSSNDPFHIRVEQLSESVWCPGEQGRWFYERARGQYQVAQNRFGTTAARRRRFKEQTPPARKFTKTDLAKYLASWAQLPHQVSKGAQKNFVLFMQQERTGAGSNWEPDALWYRHMIAKAILFKTAERIARQERFPAYRANIVTYLVAYLSYKVGRNIDLDRIWQQQAASGALEDLMRQWSHGVYRAITGSAQGKNVTEWAKKDNCWNTVMHLDLQFPTTLPPEVVKKPKPSATDAHAVVG